WLVLSVLLLGLASSSWLALTYSQAKPTPARWVANTTTRMTAPPAEAAISLANINQITSLARWGKGRVSQVAYDPSGQWLALASSQGIFLYDAETLTEVTSIETGTQVWSIAFSPDGKLLASSLADHSVRLWQVAECTHLPET